jgi:CRISPR-associated endoribonuclease Cas6
MALIKEALNRADGNYKDLLFPDKSSIYSKKTKPFSFSLYIPSEYIKNREKFYLFLNEDLMVEDTVFYPASGRYFCLFISSSDYEFMINLYNGLCQIKELDFFKFLSTNEDTEKVQIGKISMLNERKINRDEVLFKTLSYISVEDEHDRPIEIFKEDGRTIDSQKLERFNHHLNEIQHRILRDIRGYGLRRPLEFIPLSVEKVGVKHALKEFWRHTGRPYMVLTTYKGTFCLRGDPEDLQLLYQTGIGLRTGQGFGMIDIING